MVDPFAAISDPTRRGILERLRQDGALSVTELAAPLPISRQAVTKHLDILERSGLIEHEWRGRKRVHLLKAEPLREVDDWLAPYAAAWDERLARLEDYLDGDHDEGD